MDGELFHFRDVYKGKWVGTMTNAFIRMLISTCAAYVLFAHLKIEAHPTGPTLKDWVGTHEAYPVTEALVSDPTVDASVREQARLLFSIPSISPSIGIEPFGFPREPLPQSHFSGRKLSIDIEIPEQPEAMWMLGRVFDHRQNIDSVFTCYHNGMVEDLPVDGRILITFDIVDRHARILQRKIDGEYLENIADCVEDQLDGLEVADGIHELVTVELTYQQAD